MKIRLEYQALQTLLQEILGSVLQAPFLFALLKHQMFLQLLLTDWQL